MSDSMRMIHLKRKFLRQQNANFGKEFRFFEGREIEEANRGVEVKAFRAARNCEFLVQFYHELHGVTRLSVNRTMVDDEGGWKEGISWDVLQWIKSAVGMGGRFAVEAFPEDGAVVNVSNIRHLWVLPEGVRPEWAWGGVSNGRSGLIAARLLVPAVGEPAKAGTPNGGAK